MDGPEVLSAPDWGRSGRIGSTHVGGVCDEPSAFVLLVNSGPALPTSLSTTVVTRGRTCRLILGQCFFFFQYKDDITSDNSHDIVI